MKEPKKVFEWGKLIRRNEEVDNILFLDSFVLSSDTSLYGILTSEPALSAMYPQDPMMARSASYLSS